MPAQGPPYGPRQGPPQDHPYGGNPYGAPHGMPQEPWQPPQGRPPQGQDQRRPPRSAPPQDPYGPAPGPRRRLLWTAAVTGGVLVLLIAVIAVTGGFASDGTAPPTVPLGKSIDQTEFQTTVLNGYWAQHTNVIGQTTRTMVARLRVTNVGDRTASLDDYLKTVVPLQAWGAGLLSTIDTTAYIGSDKVEQLPPGIPVDVLAHYTPNTSDKHATTLNLRFCQIQHRSDFYYRGHQVWVPACDGWGVFDRRELVAPRDISGPGITQQQKVQKANELHKQGEAARKKKVFSYTGIVAQVNVPLKGAS